MWRTTYLHGPAVLRRICRLGRAPRNMTPTGRKWTTRLPAIRARTLLSQKPILESLVCPNKASVPVIAAALLTQAESADCPRLKVLYDVLAVSIPRIDAVSETGAIVYRHFFLPHSSSSSRFTAGVFAFFILSQSD